MVAINLISSARIILKLDIVYTEYSAQYLMDYVCPEKEDGKLTVKDVLKFALKERIPKQEDWRNLGCLFKRPSSSCNAPPLVSLKGELIEPKNQDQMLELFGHQPIGARLHVSIPELDVLGDGMYVGPSGHRTNYVGFRDVIKCEIKQIGETLVATVKICYKKKESFIKVALNAMFLGLPKNGDESQVIEPTRLLVDFCLPRLSIK